MNALRTKGGIALIAGALLNITRMIPVYADQGVTSENFPPHAIEDTIYVTQLYAWHLSHIMALVSVPLLAFGFVTLFGELKNLGAVAQGLAALVGGITSFVLYLIGAITDGLILPSVVRTHLTLNSAGLWQNDLRWHWHCARSH